MLTNKEFQNYLKEYPDDLEVVVYVNGAIWAEADKPVKRFMGTNQKDMLIIPRKL